MMWLLTCFLGCASMDAAIQSGREYAPGGAELDTTADQLRIDIIPGESTPFLDPQSWLLGPDEDLGALNIDILPSVPVSGQLVGYSATPHGAEVPGADETPVDGLVSMFRLGSIAGASAATDTNGRFSLRVPPSTGYQLSAIPADGQSLPFFVDLDSDVSAETDLGMIDLGYGVPVFGRVTSDGSTGVSGAGVRLLEIQSGQSGSQGITGANGQFILRAQPGEYILSVYGIAGRAVPSIVVPVTALEEHGAEVDVVTGSLDTISVFGQVFGEDSNTPQRDVSVRFTSDALSDSNGSLVIETETDGDGVFTRNLLPGSWLVEFIPLFDSAQAPTQISFELDEDQGSHNLTDVLLPSRSTFSSVAIDPAGNPVAGVAVNARELGFDGYIRSTTTDQEGRFALDLSPQPMAFMLVPPGQDLAVTHALVDPVSDRGSLALDEGELVEGRITSRGIGVPFALIEIRDANGLLYATSLSDPDGLFSVRMEPN